jgi:protein-glutamine gamma-glutamyltransferase
LVQQWREELGNAPGADAAFVQRALQYFRDNKFTYTLQPPLLGPDPIDQLLFETKQGFCEHFSQTFVVMARMAGIPARVVTGYQGGEKNPVDGFYSIYQSDAHAWSEVWLNGRGWTRVDPTAAVAGLRIDAGAAAALARPRGLPALIQLDSNWVRSLNYNWQAIQNAWNQWVLTYNPERQKSVLDKLGFDEPNWRNMAIALGIAMGTLMAIVSAALFLRRRTLDPLDAAWARVSRTLARIGLAREPHEGPEAYARRVAKLASAELAENPRSKPIAQDGEASSGAAATIWRVQQLAQRYSQLKYGKRAPDDAKHRQAVMQFAKDAKGLTV